MCYIFVIKILFPLFYRVVALCKYFQASARSLSTKYFSTLRRYNYVTPTSYLELILTFKVLLNKKRHEIDLMRNRYLVGLDKLEFASSQVSLLMLARLSIIDHLPCLPEITCDCGTQL